MCRLHHEGCLAHNRGSKVRQDIYEKVGFKTRKIVKHSCCKILVATLLWENENRCAEFTMRGRRGKIQVARIARTSMKICGPTRRDDCKNHDELKFWKI